MKIMVIGGGGREHALVNKLAQSSRVSKIICAPGNAGIAQIAEVFPQVKANDVRDLYELAVREKPDLVLPGPEEALSLGIVDFFKHHNLRIFGPTRRAALLETSKIFAKKFMQKWGIPTAKPWKDFYDYREAISYINSFIGPLVVKADGLTTGKGVFPCESKEEAIQAITRLMIYNELGIAGHRVVIERRLKGWELSFIVFTDGKIILPLAAAQDYKALYDGDKGPNTGGIGAYSPVPMMTKALEGKIVRRIMYPVINGMAIEGYPYRGVLYAGLIIENGEPKVLEFNARFGDPETQPQLVRMKSDIVPILECCIDGNLYCGGHYRRIEWDERPAICVVLVSKGYPGPYEKGVIIPQLKKAEDMIKQLQKQDNFFFHAGTARRDGQFITDGGRVLGVTALGNDWSEASNNVYSLVASVTWEGAYYRNDIGRRVFERQENV